MTSPTKEGKPEIQLNTAKWELQWNLDITMSLVSTKNIVNPKHIVISKLGEGYGHRDEYC